MQKYDFYDVVAGIGVLMEKAYFCLKDIFSSKPI